MSRYLGPVPPPDQPWPLLWPDPESGPFRVRLWFDRVNGMQSVVGVEMWGIEPRAGDWTMGDGLPDTGIRSEDVRLPLGELRDWWIAMQLARPRAAEAAWEALPEDQRKPRAVHEAAVAEFEEHVRSEAPRRAGRPFLSDEQLQRVTEVYNDEIKKGGRRPTKRVFDELGAEFGAGVYKTAAGWVSVARKRGYPVLPPPQKPTKTEEKTR